MPLESSHQSGGVDCVRSALAEIRAYPGELQAFVSGMLEQWDDFAEKLRTCELARQQALRHSECESLQKQIDRLEALTAQLADTVAEQKRSTGK
jgi:hypothetical protein